MRSFLLTAFAGAAYAATPIENITKIVDPPVTITNKATTPVTLGTVAVNSGFTKTGTGSDAALNLKFEIVTTEAAANNFTDNTSIWWVTFGKDATTASAEMMRITFNTPTVTTGTAKTTQTCATGVIKVAPGTITDAKAEFNKIAAASLQTQTAVLQADGYESTNPTPLVGFWSVDQAGATNTATAWTSRWTRTAVGETNAKVGGTVYSHFQYNKVVGTAETTLWTWKGDFKWAAEAPVYATCDSPNTCVACTGTQCDASKACSTSAITLGNCTPVKQDCTTLKKAVDDAKTAGVQTVTDAANAAWKQAGCAGASALYGSLVAVAVGIFATSF